MNYFFRMVCPLLMAVVLCTACVPTSRQPTQEASDAQLSSSAFALSVLETEPSEGNDLADAVQALRSYNPEYTEIHWDHLERGQSLAVTYKLLEDIAAVLTQNPCTVSSALPDVISSEDFVLLTLHTAQGRKVKWVQAQFSLLSNEQQNGEYAGKMLAEFHAGTGDFATFVFERSAFWQITDLLSAMTSQVPLSVSENAVKMQTAVTAQAKYPVLSDCLQFGDTLLCGWHLGNDGIAECPFEAIDAKTGEILYTYVLQEYPARVEKMPMQGYDYRLVLSDRILYKDSTDASKEQIWKLPEAVKTKLWKGTADDQSAFDADPQADLLAYAARNGVWLAKSDGSGEELVLDAEGLSGLLEEIDIPAELNPQVGYLHPVLMNGGKQVAATIVYWSDGNGDAASYGVGIYDVASGKTTVIPDIFAWLSNPAKPLDEKILYAIGGSGMRLIDVESGEYRTVDFDFHEENSFDYRTFARTQDGRNEQGNRVWKLLLREGQQEGQELITAFCDYLYVRAMTQDYIVCDYGRSGEEGEKHFCIVPQK